MKDNKKKVVSILMALSLGGVSGHYIDDIVEKYNLQADRYPLDVEYSIIKKCISIYSEPISEKIYGNKKNICICALKKTELDYDYSSFNNDKNKFLNIFKINVKKCM